MDRHDHYFREAKREGYLSRAAYKLIEIDERKRVLKPGDCVLDCGAAPGSWLQVAAQRVGERGVVVGIDLQDITYRATGVHVITGDLRETPAEALLAPLGDGRKFDVVLSDMAPSTTGDQTIDHHQSVRLCRAVLQRCADVLVDGGRLVMKVFEGEAYPALLEETRALFKNVKGFKPKASRSISREMYIVADGYRGTRASNEEQVAPPRRKPEPGRGWGRKS